MKARLILSSFFNFLLLMTINAQVKIIPAQSFLNYTCPNEVQSYSIESQNNYGLIVWKVSGGHFNSAGSGIKEISSFTNNVYVFWDNVKSIDGATPIGTLYVEVYNKFITSQKIGYDKYIQKIKSLNDINTNNLVSVPSSTILPRGTQVVKL